MFDWTVTLESREWDGIRLYDEDDGRCRISRGEYKDDVWKETASVSVRPEILQKMLGVFIEAQNAVMEIARSE